MMKRLLVLIVVLVFLGVVVIPGITQNMVIASLDDDLVEVTTQACGTQGYGDTTVKLTREQYQNLESYLVEFRDRLNQTSTREEAIPIFKDAVVELEKYGLLPRGMSVERAQKLVIGSYQKTKLYLDIEKTIFRNQKIDFNTSNFLCLIYSNTDGIISVGPFLHSINRIYFYQHEFPLIMAWFYFKLYGHEFLINIIYTIWSIIYLTVEKVFNSSYSIASRIPIKVFNTLTFGSVGVANRNTGPIYNPTNGWVVTFGLNGIKIFQNQSLYGHLFLFPIYYDDYVYFPGVFGFTGIQITSEERMIHLGFALCVDIGSEPSW